MICRSSHAGKYLIICGEVCLHPRYFFGFWQLWLVIPGPPLVWVLFILFSLAFPVYAHLQTNLLTHPRGIPWTSHFWTVLGDVRINTAQFLFVITVLAHQAYSNTDAIIRTLYRKFISHKRLLEWTTAAQRENEEPSHPVHPFFARWQTAVLLSFISLAFVIWLRPSALPVAAPFLLVWMLSPFVAYRISLRPPVSDSLLCGDGQKNGQDDRQTHLAIFRNFCR